MNPSRRNEILLGVFFLLAIGLLVGLAHLLSGTRASREIEVTGEFENASGLVPDNAVAVAGVPIGRVKRIEVAFDRARIVLGIDAQAGLRQDAQARIRPKSLLGEKYVELVPVSKDAPLLKDGDTLKNTEVPVELDQLFLSLKPFFERLGPMAPEIESTVHELGTLLKSLNETGKSKRETLERIIDRTDTLLVQLTGFVEKNGAPLNATLKKSERLLDTTNGKLPKLLAHADESLTRLDTLAQAVPIETLKKLPQSYAKLDAALSALAPFAERLNQNGERIESILKRLDLVLARVAQIDELALRRFLQEEGVNVNLTQDAASKKRIKALDKGER